MKAAYYSRNNSYSRSAGAEYAEREGRYPRTRAAKELGLSVKAFDAGCAKINHRSTEWHHIGKYANRVDYYDTHELAANPLFWRGAMNKANAAHCKNMASKAIWARLNERMMPEIKKQADYAVFFIKDDEYSAKLAIDSEHNMRKIIREIARNRAIAQAQQHKWENRITKKWRFFYLNRNGAIITGGKSPVSYSDIEWDNYAPVLTNGESVLFKHVKFLS